METPMMIPYGEPIYKIAHPERRKEVLEVLQNSEAHHDNRTWMVFFCKSLGLTAEDVLDFIQRYGRWKDYDPSITKYHVNKIFRKETTHYKQHSDTIHGLLQLQPRAKHMKLCPLDEPNRSFFTEALETVTEWRLGAYSWTKMNWSPKTCALYRTIEGTDHVLFVIDIDSEDDLAKAWRVTKRLIALRDWDWTKFSGCKGFHLIEKLPIPAEGIPYDYLAKMAERLWAQVDTEGLQYDPRMFHKRRLIRGYSINFKTKPSSMSTAIQMDDSLDRIKERARRLVL